MTPDELKKILAQPEGPKLDFKREYKLNKKPPSGSNTQEWSLFVKGQWDEFIKDILGLTNGNIDTAGQIGYLVIGAKDELPLGGMHEPVDTSNLDIDEKKIIQRVNEVSDPPIPRIHCERVQIDDKWLTVISIPPTPYVHETNRELQVTKGDFDSSGQLRNVKSEKAYSARTVFVRRNEGTEPATALERKTLEKEKSAGRYRSRIAGISMLLVVFLVAGALGILWYRSVIFKMAGEFNIAVAEYLVLDPDGSTRRSPDGKAVGEFICKRLQVGFGEINLSSINYQIECPSRIGQVKGATKDERSAVAAALAERFNANVVIYGVIIPGDRPQLVPEFFVRSKGFEQVDEIVGQHELGNAMRINLPFDPAQIQDVENPALSARANALSLITIGLAYYSVDRLDQALDYFQQAEALPGWLKNAGKEVIYLMLGNTNARLASIEKDSKYLQPAYQAYEEALQVNPAYARALVGQAGVLYLQALGDPNDPSMATIDFIRLGQAESSYEKALSLTGTTESANIQTKASFGLGQIYLVHDQVQGAGWMDKAREQFLKVIQDYESGDLRVVELASQSYARLGLIARLQNDVIAAEEYYKEAIRTATPFFQAYYYTRLGELYADDHQPDKAIEAYQEAIRIAEFNGDATSVERYMKRLNELNANRPQS